MLDMILLAGVVVAVEVRLVVRYIVGGKRGGVLAYCGRMNRAMERRWLWGE